MSKPLLPVMGAQARLFSLAHSQGLGKECLHYGTKGGRARMECRFFDAPLWRSHSLFVESLQSSKQNSRSHVKNVLAERLKNEKERM